MSGDNRLLYEGDESSDEEVFPSYLRLYIANGGSIVGTLTINGAETQPAQLNETSRFNGCKPGYQHNGRIMRTLQLINNANGETLNRERGSCIAKRKL